MRAAASALSVAAYHEENTDRMGRSAPGLIPVLVSLLPHPDPEVQAHAATALANLSHGSPSYQSEAGEAGAIRALLNVCRGRADIDGGDDVLGGDGVGDGDGGDDDGGVSPTITGRMLEDSDSQRKGSKSHGSEAAKNTRREEAKQGGSAKKEGEEKKEEEGGGRTGESARKGDSKKEDTTLSVAITNKGDGGRGCGQDQNNEIESDREVGEGLMAMRQQPGGVEDEGGEEGGAAATMDVDAVQAATAALANLLCYSETNSVRLVAAGGIGVLVGLVSSYRPQNLLDFDQVCVCVNVRAGGVTQRVTNSSPGAPAWRVTGFAHVTSGSVYPAH